MKTFKQLIERLLSAKEGGEKYGPAFAANRARRLANIEAARNDAMKKAKTRPQTVKDADQAFIANKRWSRTANILNRADDTMSPSRRQEFSPSGSEISAYDAEAHRLLSRGVDIDSAISTAGKKAGRLFKQRN